MTRRPHRLLLLAMFAVAVVLVLGVWLLWPRSAIEAGNFAKIRVGMTLAEVEDILGGPARDDSVGPVEVLFDELVVVAVADDALRKSGPGAEDASQAPRVWTSERLRILVWLDTDGRVIFGHAAPVRRFQEGLLDRVRRRFGL